jgi:hypothetical protein
MARIAIGTLTAGATTVPEVFTDAEDYAGRIYEAYVQYPHMTPELAVKIADVALRLNANPFDLANLIYHESRFNPRIQNPTGKVLETRHGARRFAYRPFGPPDKAGISRPPATGLIQFLGSTLTELGFKTEDLWYMSAEDQMDIVAAYLRARIPSNPSVHQLHMAVFYPAYADDSATRAFPPKVTESNPGIHTPADYTKAALAQARLTSKGAIRGQQLRSPYIPHPDEIEALREARRGTIADDLGFETL